MGAEHDTMDPAHLRSMAERLPRGTYHHSPIGEPPRARRRPRGLACAGLLGWLRELDGLTRDALLTLGSVMDFPPAGVQTPRMRIRSLALAVVALLLAVLAACGGDGGDENAEDRAGGGGSGDETSSAAPSDEGPCAEAEDLLAQVCEKGVLTVSTDPAYPPQSSLDEQTGEYEGFDIDVATEIATRLGLDVAWEAPSWDVITAGSWNGRWDTTVGSMTPTNDRQEVLYFTEPYNYTPAVVVVGADDDSVSDLTTDLDGKKIGVCAGCTYDQFLTKDLAIDGYDVRLRHRRRRGLGLRHRHHRAAGPGQRPGRRGDHLGDHRAGLHRRRQPGADRR